MFLKSAVRVAIRMECVTDILRDLLLKQKALLSQWLADLNNTKKNVYKQEMSLLRFRLSGFIIIVAW